MKNLRQVFLGILIAVVSIGLLLGGFSLSLAEGNSLATFTPTTTPTFIPTSSPTWQSFTPTALTTSSVSTTPSLASPTPRPSLTPSLTLTAPPTPINCPPRPGWLVYFVQPGETVDSIAIRYRISSAELQNANCLLTLELIPGVVIYVPPMRTQTPLPCGAPNSWVVYYVQPGDTLYRLSLTYGTTVAKLQSANCLGASTLLHTGQTLYVPPGLPRPVAQTAAVLVMPTSLPSDTPPAAFTKQPTDTLIPAASEIPAEAPSAAPIPATP